MGVKEITFGVHRKTTWHFETKLVSLKPVCSYGAYTTWHVLTAGIKSVYYAVLYKYLNVSQVNRESEVLNSVSDIHMQIIISNRSNPD
jgi:hypothetical protein